MGNLKVILGALVLLVSVQSNAALVERDLFSPGDGLVTFDSSSGLEWLDMSLTLELSYNDVIGGVGNTWIEDGPSVDITLQWATYRDASDEASLSRIWGGIHPPVDDVPGRIIGMQAGTNAFNRAEQYFNGEEH